MVLICLLMVCSPYIPMSRFYFDLSLTSSRDWRISHGLSHHFYTNMHLDIEVSLFQTGCLLAVQNSSIGDLVTHSLTD